MTQPITVLQISLNPTEEQQFKKEGFTKVDGNLNSGTDGPIELLWYKRVGDKPVTRIQFSFRDEMNGALSAAGFAKVNKNINAGTKGDDIYLWYISGTTDFDIPIVDLKVTTKLEDEPNLFRSGWERLGCDLNRNAGGDPVYLWVKRSQKTYICDITATIDFSADEGLLQQGSYRVDEDTNRGAKPPGSAVFLWYLHSKDQDGAVTDIDVSLNGDQEKHLKQQGFTKVKNDLNNGTTGGPVYLWYKCSNSPALQYFTVLDGERALNVYKTNNCKVVEKNLNNDNKGLPLYIAYM